jgi:hypothetical protein
MAKITLTVEIPQNVISAAIAELIRNPISEVGIENMLHVLDAGVDSQHRQELRIGKAILPVLLQAEPKMAADYARAQELSSSWDERYLVEAKDPVQIREVYGKAIEFAAIQEKYRVPGWEGNTEMCRRELEDLLR